MVTAIDIAILPPEPVRSLAIKLSKQINEGDFRLNEVDILPHVTLAIGFVENVEVVRKKVAEIVNRFEPMELIVERIEGRIMMIKKSTELDKLHRQITVQVDFVQPDNFSGAYFVKDGQEVSEQNREYTGNFKSQNAFGNYIPHITIGWDDEVSTGNLKAKLPQKFIANEVSICQLGKNNTCRRVLARLQLGK